MRNFVRLVKWLFNSNAPCPCGCVTREEVHDIAWEQTREYFRQVGQLHKERVDRMFASYETKREAQKNESAPDVTIPG